MAEEKERVGRIRKGNLRGGFTTIQNSLINDLTLSPEARALMIYLLSKPEDWELQVNDVRRLLGVTDKPCGRNKGYRVIRELRDRAYLVMCENLNNGHYAGVTYYIFHEPHPNPDSVRKAHEKGGNGLDFNDENPLPENQEAEHSPRAQNRDTDNSPCPPFPYPQNGHATNKRDIQNTDPPLPPKRRTKHRRNGSETSGAKPPPLAGVIADPWGKEWITHRINVLLRGREQAPSKPTRFLEQMINRGGEAGEKARFEHEAKTCWPTIAAMDAAAVNDGRGWRVPEKLFEAGALDDFRSTAIDSPEFQEWQDEHRRRGWPELPIPRTAQRVWLPASGLAALNLRNAQGEQAA
ncbi:hypothetical protein AGR7C_Cc160143 [Agrobacterium deltaense Zutra 3/1]|uniref:Helix-turn-helix domain-containing protein n=1 Tax=Agrobacterium deltaense Zutra 3/1 TaxID=1183427 RepID=A0A1S7PMK2_9HYPH|nr:hypothetical protein [Agrobacterium deltaense]CUX23240.1 hypothetical protein AGR7C_Cc160143 [Agrobacterium deltaense Zutra 3/1]